jgi:hypothetical protein
MLSSAGSIGRSTTHPYDVFHKLDGDVYIFGCDTVNAIDDFLMNECSENMTSAQIKYIEDLTKYEDDLLVRNDLIALDALLFKMVTSGKSCIEIQGGNCGTI